MVPNWVGLMELYLSILMVDLNHLGALTEKALTMAVY
jgi:hypothetical protein